MVVVGVRATCLLSFLLLVGLRESVSEAYFPSPSYN